MDALYPVEWIEHLPVPMRDGTVLSASVLLPASRGDGPWPAVVDFVPYRKDDDFLWLFHETYRPVAARGVACVQLDLRGTGSSEGILRGEYLAQEQDDACDLLAFLAQQDWCTGRCGATGVSWGGFAAIQLAMRRPPELGAIVPIHFTHDRYSHDVHYRGGQRACWDAVDWPGEMIVEMPMPPHPGHVGWEAFERMWTERLQDTPQWSFDWLHHQRRDAFWVHGSARDDWDSIEVPTLAIGGWFDGYVDACLEVLANVKAPTRAVIGPWGHARPAQGWPEPAYEHRVLMARWFRRWLADEQNGVDEEPQLVAHVMDGMPRDPIADSVEGEWRAWKRWPLGSQEQRPYALGADGVLGGEGNPQPQSWSGPWSVGVQQPHWDTGSAPPSSHTADVREDDAVSLCWETPPLEHDVEIVGRPEVRLRVSANRPVALVAARLSEVAPDGASMQVTREVLNLARRDSMAEPEPLVPGEIYEVSLVLRAAGCAFRAGHRIRIALSGSDWPNVFPPGEAFTLTVHGGSLILPIAPPADADPALPALVDESETADNPVDDDPAWDHPTTWDIERDGGVTRTSNLSGWRSLIEGGGVSEGHRDVRAEIADDDPGTAQAVGLFEQAVVHGGVEARAKARLQVRGEPSDFALEIDLRVERDGAQIYERSWRARFPRDLA